MHMRRHNHLKQAFFGYFTMANLFLHKLVTAIGISLLACACDRAGETADTSRPHWQLVAGSDLVDGSETVHMMVAAENRMESQREPAALVLSCEGGTTDAYVIWRQYLGTYNPDVTWRVGSDPDVTETWRLSTDNEAIFAPEPVKLIKHMMANEHFLIKTSPFGSSPVTLLFNTNGLETEVTPLREACAW
jgi:hypothetical protein